VGNSRGARKLARTPYANQKKKKEEARTTFSYDTNKEKSSLVN
jgi:hypothetical protein